MAPGTFRDLYPEIPLVEYIKVRNEIPNSLARHACSPASSLTPGTWVALHDGEICKIEVASGQSAIARVHRCEPHTLKLMPTQRTRKVTQKTKLTKASVVHPPIAAGGKEAEAPPGGIRALRRRERGNMPPTLVARSPA